MSRRLRASSVHLGVSLGVAALAGLLIFLVWYPSPYGVAAGGLALFLILVGVDVILGPSLTAVVASPGKPIKELRRDIALIALVQLLAFAYGVYSIALARPVYMVFEVDRFRVVSAADVDPSALSGAQPQFRQLPWTGPRLIATRPSANGDETVRSIILSINGIDLGMQPDRWIEYDAAARASVATRSRPVDVLLQRYPQATGQVQRTASKASVEVASVRFLPLVSRRAEGVVLLAQPDMRVVGYVKVDGFF